ncbi:MAG: NUDIX domain-containing protein [Patescibacteria group bacterium]|nr:NUDIX domain-containing protein [Patescibacteria group bacterium]
MAGWMIDEKDPAREEIVRRAMALGIAGSPNKAAHNLGKLTLADGKEVTAHIVHAVDPIITDGDEVVMINRSREPGMGKPALPGGFIDPKKGGGVESAVQAAAREAMEEVGVALHDGTLVGTRNMNRPFDVRVAQKPLPEYGIAEGDVFMVSTQAVRFDVPDLKATKLVAGDDALPGSARRVKLSVLTRDSVGIPDHYDMIKGAFSGQPISRHDWMIDDNDPVREEIVRRAMKLGITGTPDKAAHNLGKLTLANGKEVIFHVVHAVDPVITDGNSVVMVNRKYPPGVGRLALPGGFLDPAGGGGAETAIQAAAREALEEAGVTVGKGVLVGERYMDRRFDIRVARFNVDEPGISPDEQKKRQNSKEEFRAKYGIEEGDLFMVSTQAVRFDVPDLEKVKLVAGNEIVPGSARLVKLRDLSRDSVGIPDHYDMIMEAMPQVLTSTKHTDGSEWRDSLGPRKGRGIA